MKPSLKLLYVALEHASFTYADTGSVFAKERALELIKETRDCLDDIEQLIENANMSHAEEVGVQP